LGKSTFAPALEHGNQSNEEQNDGATGKNLHQHDMSPLSLSESSVRNFNSFCSDLAACAVTLVTPDPKSADGELQLVSA